ncbi:hypothetical protein [Nonomuraea sp. NPDC003709]|uniref:hypothetical protein n=1 Tax=unclassified Nonomuraea TaxID=2593643 RepID=UPI0033AF0CF6
MRIAIIGGALVLAGALAGVGFVGTAHAGTDGATAPAARSGNLSGRVGAKVSCYDIWINDVGFYRSVTIKNKCGQTKQVRARIAWWPNGPCWTIRPGGYRTHYYRSPGTFYNLKKC